MTLVIVAVGVAIAAIVRVAFLHRRIRRLARLTIADPLTGAYNRRHMESCLAAAIERRSRIGEPASLLLFDVDRFKTINDALGHAAGDRALRAIVGLVDRRVRRLDALFRVGGDEFAVLLTDASLTAAFVVAEDLRVLVANARVIDGRRVSISVGVSELADRESPAEWLANADAALYVAKRGRNRVASRDRKLWVRHPTPSPLIARTT
jgi:diguanylate cyclase (GGDEF)-like protein